MGLHYKNLDDETRKYMIEEDDIGGHYESPRIQDGCMPEWRRLFRQAIESKSDNWLADAVERAGLMKSHETRRKSTGGTSVVKVPHNAAQQLAEGEFNRFYLRGIAARALAEGKSTLHIYRGKEVSVPRPESARKIGTEIDAEKLLFALRDENFVDNALGLPAGPNSGLTAEIM